MISSLKRPSKPKKFADSESAKKIMYLCNIRSKKLIFLFIHKHLRENKSSGENSRFLLRNSGETWRKYSHEISKRSHRRYLHGNDNFTMVKKYRIHFLCSPI